MFLEAEFFAQSCANEFALNMGIKLAAVWHLTGMVVVRAKNHGLTASAVRLSLKAHSVIQLTILTSVGSTNYHVGIGFFEKPISKQLAD